MIPTPGTCEYDGCTPSVPFSNPAGWTNQHELDPCTGELYEEASPCGPDDFLLGPNCRRLFNQSYPDDHQQMLDVLEARRAS